MLRLLVLKALTDQIVGDGVIGEHAGQVGQLVAVLVKVVHLHHLLRVFKPAEHRVLLAE